MGAPVFPKESYGTNLWSQVSITLNNTPLPPGNDYPYTAALIDILGTSPESRKGVLTPLAGFMLPRFGTSKIDDISNPNPYMMNTMAARLSKEITVYDRIHNDFMMSCTQLLPNKMQLGITLTKSKDSFVLGVEEAPMTDNDGVAITERMAPEDYRLEIREVSLFVRRVQLNPAAMREVAPGLAKGGKLLYQRLQTVAYPCPKDSRSWNWHNCFNNIIPGRVFMAIVSQEAYFGNYKRVSNYLESANVAVVRFCADGREIMAEPYRCDFHYNQDGSVDQVNTDAKTAYAGLCRAIRSFGQDRQHVGIEYTNFKDGSTVYAVAMDQAGSLKPVSGSFDIHIEFTKGVEEPMMVIVMGEMYKTLGFDANRNITEF